MSDGTLYIQYGRIARGFEPLLRFCLRRCAQNCLVTLHYPLLFNMRGLIRHQPSLLQNRSGLLLCGQICAVNLSYSGTLYKREGDESAMRLVVFRIRGHFYRRYGIYRQSNSSGSMWKERYMTLPTLCHVAIRPSSS